MKRTTSNGLYRVLAALGPALLLGGCLGEELGELEELETRQSAYTAVQPHGVRPNIWDFGATARSQLVNGILAFITQPVLDQHANAPSWHTSTETFFTGHHGYLNQLENYLLNNGLGQFVPVPEWDPANSIPSQFLVADPLVSQTAMNPTPDMHLSDAIDVNNLCAFSTGGDLAAAVRPWHNSVHVEVGGAMANVMISPGAPIFWLWHGFLDDLYHEYKWDCQIFPSLVTVVL